MFKYRMLEPVVADALDAFRVVSVTGARQVGKTTLVRRICERRGMSFVSLEDAATRAAAQSDADAWLAGFPGPVAIDEVQHAPDLFRAIKKRVDAHQRPGQILITGSALWLSMRTIGESLAGRVALLELGPFSLAESLERSAPAWNPLLSGEFDLDAVKQALRDAGSAKPDWLAQAVLRGGYPEPSSFAKPEARSLWFDSYLSTYLQRDVLDLVRIEHANLFLRLVRLLAGRTGQMLNLSSLARDLGLPVPTVRRYADWLTLTYQRFDIQPYSVNVGKRLTKTPKSYWGDTGMAAGLLGWRTWRDVQQAGADGALLETWVASELGKWASVHSRRPFYFWRSHGGREADFLFERDSRVVAIEIKGGHRVDARDLRGLAECREALGARFRHGIVLYGGTEILPLGNRLFAVPLALLRGGSRSRAGSQAEA
jgi:predicted AAA+ superfamily ATPase